MLLTRRQLAPLVPHGEGMLMIDSVTAFDDQSIRCESRCHQAENNPLRRDGRLSAHHAIEFAAQAAAVHGGLIDKSRRAPLRALAAVRKACFARSWLDDLESSLEIEASVVLVDQQAAVYHASLKHLEEEEVASMRLTLMTIEAEFKKR